MVDVLGFEGLYSISRDGRVYSYYSEKLLGQEKTKNGYLRVTLYKDGVAHKKSVHRLIAKAFLSNPNNYPIINHRNGIKDDNRVENLEWCTQSHNVKHGWEHGNAKVSDKMRESAKKKAKAMGLKNRKISIDDASEILEAIEYTDITHLEVAKHYGVSRGAISQMVKRSKL